MAVTAVHRPAACVGVSLFGCDGLSSCRLHETCSPFSPARHGTHSAGLVVSLGHQLIRCRHLRFTNKETGLCKHLRLCLLPVPDSAFCGAESWPPSPWSPESRSVMLTGLDPVLQLTGQEVFLLRAWGRDSPWGTGQSWQVWELRKAGRRGRRGRCRDRAAAIGTEGAPFPFRRVRQAGGTGPWVKKSASCTRLPPPN